MRFYLILIVILYWQVAFAKKAFDTYEHKVEIPEPLFIDLVRSLSAEPGEWEINSLFYHTQGNFDSLHWAPELELVLKSGTAVEFELPMVGGKISSYKTAIQQRVYQNSKRNHQQGLQFIYEADNKFYASEATLFYIIAHRFNHYFSIIGLYGLKSIIETYQGLDLLLNQSLFFNYSQEIDFGIEFNYQSGPISPKYWQVVPQLHLAFEDGAKIQFGFGAREQGTRISPMGTFRLIWEFNK